MGRRSDIAIIVALALIASDARPQAVIEEIRVTARKVEESLKDIPLAITALSSDTIEAAGITNLWDVAELTPGLSFFNAFGENLPVPVIRGVVPTNIFAENATAIFVDGVFVSGREGLNFSQLDLERIEIVKGPQSALYGRNAFSGAINYVTKRPSEEFEAKAEAQTGNEGKQKVLGMLGGPIFSDKIRGRISALYDEWDGSYNNSWAPKNDIGGYRYRSLQSRLDWLPTDNLDISLGLYYSNDEIDDPAAAAIPANCEDRIDDTPDDVRFQNFCGEVPDLDEMPEPRKGLIDGNSIPVLAEALGEDRDLIRGNLNIAWELDYGTLESLSGYSNTEQQSKTDFGHSVGELQPFLYCPEAAIFVSNDPRDPNVCISSADQQFFSGVLNPNRPQETEEISQEIRFTSPQDRSLRYVVGGYYYDVESDNFQGDPLATQPLPEGLIGLPPFDPSAQNLAIGTAIFYSMFTPDAGLDPLHRVFEEETTEGWAVFSAVEYDLTERLTGRAELRFSHTQQTSRLPIYTQCGKAPGANGLDVIDPDCGDDIWDVRIRESLPACAPGQEENDADGNLLCSPAGSVRFSDVTGRLGLDFRVSDAWMLYGSIAKGEKPGDLQLDTLTVLTPEEEERVLRNPVDPEEMIAYELGLKGRTPDGRVGLDVAMFFNDWNDIVLRQIRDADPESGLPLSGPFGFESNIGDAEVWGFEIELDVAFTENLRGRLTAARADAELTNAIDGTFETWPSFAPDGDVTGNKLLRQPEWMASASLSYARPLSVDWEWFSRGDLSWQDKVFVGNDNQSTLPSHTYLNLSLGIQSERYSLEFWGRNLFEDDGAIAAFRDVYFANTSELYPPYGDLEPRPNFDHFVPLRYTVSYPRLRTWGITAKMRFGTVR